MRLYCINYNNYINRKIKVLGTIAGYAAYLPSGASYINEANFNPNDNVMTEQIIGSSSQPWTYGDPDYVVVTDDNATTIISRWFVIDATRLRYGQYRLTLRHDVVADKKAVFLTNPAMITKAMLDISDDGIFNPEPMTFSQVKKQEILLKDVTQQGWVVGYFSPHNTDETISWPADNGIYAPSYGSLSDLPFYASSKIIQLSGTTITNGYTTVQYGSQGFGVQWIESAGLNMDRTYVYSSSDWETEAVVLGSTPLIAPDVNFTGRNIAVAIGPHVSGMQTALRNDVESSINNFLSSVGKYYKVGSSIYKVTGYTYRTKNNQVTSITSSGFPTLFNNLSTYAADSGLTGTPDNTSFYMKGDITEAQLVVEEQQAATRSIEIKTTARPLSDAPYCMFCMPLAGYYVLDGTNYYTTPEQTLKIGMEIAKGMDAHDIQILPYCPRMDFLGGSGTLFLGNVGGSQFGVADYDYAEIKEGADTVGAICFCNYSSFQFSISVSTLPSISTDPIQFKVDSMTRFLRICSPNYNGQFEITPEKNGGLKYFDVFCTYKPFNPYIQISPRFNRLYGQSFQDARGLICAGDWSIPQTSDAWTNFELSNKNYQQSFDREIQSIEFRNDKQRLMDSLGAIAGMVQGGTSGASTGAQLGGPYGAVIGAAVGAAGAGLAGGVDKQMAEELRQDALSLKKDMFSYQMQNIRATPQSLTRIGAITNVFKIWPFIEIYDAPEVEKKALYNKITYNSMTVMRIGKVEDYIKSSPTFIQGRFIWLEGLGDDYHIAQAINEEFQKGVYI